MATFLKKFLKEFSDITSYYHFLVKKTKKHDYIDTTNEWLVDNYYILVEHKNKIILDKKLIKENKKYIENHYYFLNNYINLKSYNISFEDLVLSLNKYQKDNKELFTYKDFSVIFSLLIFIYTKRLDELCREEYQNIIDKEDVLKIISNNNNVLLEDFFKEDFDFYNNKHYIFEIYNQLNRLGNKKEKLFIDLNNYLEKNNISLKELLNDEYQRKIENNLLIANIFNNLKSFLDYSQEKVLERSSYTEKLLNTDETYKKMSSKTKNDYRKRLVSIAKKKHLTEYEYLQKYMLPDEHIGFKLYKNNSNTFKTICYLLVITFITLLLDFFLSNYFIKPRILSFIILLIPISQFVIHVINNLLTKTTNVSVVPKLDYSKGIPYDNKTMVVIPTIISTEEKIKEMFTHLETFYLFNKSDNLYFTLLGDVCEATKKNLEIDKKLASYGEECAHRLNTKYKKEIFYFVYRKRVWNKSLNSYIGYERKRGALLQFNNLLLGIKEKKEFTVNTLPSKPLGIKYVITLDADTKMGLNTLLDMVGAMAHPLNKPILNKTETKVTKGYAIMQPKISVDIESSNKSYYSRIFAGVGGIDTYNEMVPNFYQDIFKEGSFVGKGIYDLEIYQKVLNNRFPNDVILSHDLLEGNYLRCAYLSDIELLDDYPDKFLPDSTRHHRWARGDTQIIGWLFPKVKDKNNKKVKNPLTLLEKYKIFDNIIRLFNQTLLLIILFISVLFLNPFTSLLWIVFVSFEVLFHIISLFHRKYFNVQKNIKKVYYRRVITDSKNIIIRLYLTFSTIPFHAVLYIDAFSKSIYRLLISHKNLLTWLTSEEATNTLDNNLIKYIKTFSFHFLISLAFLIIGFIKQNIFSSILAFIFITDPFILYLMSNKYNPNNKKIANNKYKELLNLALHTWKYFEDNLKEEYNYLIPDNYQLNREEKLDYRTSPTAIAYSLTSIIAAENLGFISKEKAITLINNILDSIYLLPKWNGHLYNWYNIKTKEVLKPRFISTVDSGNLVASLIIVLEYFKENNIDSKLCESLIKNTNFKKLYTKKNVFSIGYYEDEAKLADYNYNHFASEARLTSFIAIALGFVSHKHWLSLDKSLTTYKRRKGIISWAGTAFEYFMPSLFMKNYPNTLLDETYRFAYFCGKDYINHISSKLPWGISESAYNELDDSLNYKYKAFSTPYLKTKENIDNRIVVSPYSSLMVLNMYPLEVMKNIEKFKKLEMMGEYGLYEAYDYDNTGSVKAYFAHHLGMSLMGITNYLKDEIFQKYFHSNEYIRAYELLLKEKVQLQANIDIEMAKYKKYDYHKEAFENDIRTIDKLTTLPEMAVLSNKKYSLIIDDRGNSFSKYRNLQLNRNPLITDRDYGMYLFIKDTNTNEIFSNTYAPFNKDIDKFEATFAPDIVKFIRKDENIKTKTEIVVSQNYHAEIRKVTLVNNSLIDKELELTFYTEPILCSNLDDVFSRRYNDMFIQTFYDKETNTLIAKRKGREESNMNRYLFIRLVIDNPLLSFTYETDRLSFIGRGRELTNALGLSNKLENKTGNYLDSILSLRNNIKLEKNSKKSIYLIIGYGRSLGQIREIINHYDSKKSLEEAFNLSILGNIILTKNMNLTHVEVNTFNKMLKYLYKRCNISTDNNYKEKLSKNAITQSGLWKFGISGDYPIITVSLYSIENLEFINEILKAFEYYKNKSIFVDIVIINYEKDKYQEKIEKEIENRLYHIYAVNSFYHIPGKVTVVSGSNILEDDKRILDVASNLHFNLLKHTNLKTEVELLNTMGNNLEVYEKDKTIDLDKEKLELDNGFGGFNANSEYVIYNNNTPKPWVNVISNKNFGTIVTNNGCGFTYAYNSHNFKISNWDGECVYNHPSEGFCFNKKEFVPSKCTHGFGYSILESETKTLKHQITEFVALKDSIKIYLLKLKNKTSKNVKVDTLFYTYPVLGDVALKNSPYILSEFVEDNNYLKLRNVYHNNYSNVVVFMSSSNIIKDVDEENILRKSITTEVELKRYEEKDLVFILGSSNTLEDELLQRYQNIDNCYEELESVKKYYKNILNKIHVKTPDKSFNYMMNGWYLYQTISSRINAKAGFYQVSGGYGYRDQLQDALNLLIIDSNILKEQILINASHQFIEGDVLHWWHEDNHFGLRSRYKDDYLWLVYATIKYVEAIKDDSILTTKVAFVEGELLSEYENEKTLVFNYSNKKATLLEHCLLALDYSISQKGSHDLPLMGGGDWNDGMNRVGIKGKGESVWLGFFLYQILEKFIKIIKEFNIKIDLDKYEKEIVKLKQALNDNAWDGKYYLRAFFDNGDLLGSHENSECQIDLLSQSFAILSGVAEKERINKVITSVENELVDKKNNLIKLLTPAFSKSLNNPGYIMNYPKGIRENGGQYTHAVAWYLKALYKLGYYDKAYDYFQMINPINRSKDEKDVLKYQVEPYSLAADIYTSEELLGRGGWTWYTGSAGWFYNVGYEEILGLKLEGNYLIFNIKMPSNWKNIEITYTYLDTIYNIKYQRSKEEYILFDNKKIQDNKIILINDKKSHELYVYLK